MSEPVGTVRFTDVSKRYRLGRLSTLRGVLTSALSGKARSNRAEFWALKDLSFLVEPGGSLGLIGPNGAGKTTTLKLLSNITRPTEGDIAIEGRSASLIELGAGFHPELSGRENIFLNGAILGLKRNEIRAKLDAIIDFSGLEKFIDTPVKRYSSGMYVRLGFAVAVHVEPDILLVDEVLAVGDAAFRQQCLQRMEALRSQGTTIIFVSHNLAQVRRLCQRALLLNAGQVEYLGDVDTALAIYDKLVFGTANANSPTPTNSDQLTISNVALTSHDRSIDDEGSVAWNEPLTIHIECQARYPIIDPIIKLWFIRDDGGIAAISTSRESDRPLKLEGESRITAIIDPIQLVAGSYVVEVGIIDSADSVRIASGQSRSVQIVRQGYAHQRERGYFVPRVTWRQEPLPSSKQTRSETA